MGYVKEQQTIDEEEREARWAYVAEKNGYRCIRCGAIPPRSERDIYFRSKMCGWCEHMTNKDD
ncbi:MAG: hypothetical protein WCF22_08900 [Candidatus Sulfotelmatobacter sp.]